MLPPDFLENIESQAINIYNNLELDIIKEIAERIANVGYANTVVKNDVLIAQEMGVLYQDIVNLVARTNKSTYQDTLEIFEKAGITSIEIDDNIYEKAGLNPINIKQDKTMMEYLIASAKKTNNNLQNLAMTTANTGQQDFLNVINEAYLQTSTGAKSYSQAIIDAINKIGNKGAIVEYPSGHKVTMETAARMNIVTGINQTCGKLQQMRAEEMNWDLMELTAHSGARPSHEKWQGKIVSLSGKDGYLSLKDIGYGEITGFKGINCYHDWRPYYKGSSKTYSNDELEKMNDEKVTYNGKQITKYEAKQIQRSIERQIRQDKKNIVGLQGVLTSTTNNNKLIEETRTELAKKTLQYNTHKRELDVLIEQISSKKDNTRLFIVEKYDNKTISNITKLANKYNNSDIIGLKVNDVEIKEIGEHIISRTYGKKVRFEDVEDTLKNPVKYGKIRTDNSQQIKGENCTVVINVKTGKLITVYPKKTKKE